MSENPPRDPNEAAHRLLQQITGEYVTPKTRRAKQGGVARAEKLTPEQRSEIARNAAATRWKNADQAT